MRFAYIDSQGNEVPIPGVDALALRIELGAIGPDTELYDASADRWGPAHTHEIFHTLSRAKDDEGFVAPPPPMAPSGGDQGGKPAEPPATEEGDDGEDAPSFDLGAEGEDLLEEAPAKKPPAPPPASSASDDDLGFDLTLTDAAPGEPAAPEAPPAQAPSDEGGLGEMDFGLLPDAPADEPAAPADEPGDEGPGAFDFGGMDTLEVEGGDDDEDDDDGAMSFGGGMQLEEPLADSMDFAAPTGGGGLDLEQPMSEFDPSAPPAWMEQDGPSGMADEDAGSMDFTPGGDGSDDDDDADRDEAGPVRRERPKREPVNRPSPPRRPKQRNFAGPLIGLVVVAGLGAGGWFLWTNVLSGGGEPVVTTPALPPVTIPDIPAELLPQMRDLAEAALAGTVAELAVIRDGFQIPEEPRNAWLSGAYLGNASQYADIQEYWQGIAAFVDRVREVDTQVFHDEYVEAMEAAGVDEETRPILLERADSGFLATREERMEAYALMNALVDAALDLHGFLLTNQAQIAYEPAAGGVSRDPVLEAVPATPELGREMWDRVDAITNALDDLGTLDRVTTERLSAVLFDRIRRAGIE